MAQRLAADPQLGLLPNGEFDYTFTEHELADILGFMETQQQQSDTLSAATAAPFAAAGNSVPLQFQPHTADSGGQHTPSHSGGSHQSDEGVTVKREPSIPPAQPEQGGPLAGLNGFFPKPSGASATSQRSPLAVSTDAVGMETRNHSGTGISAYASGLGGSHKKDTSKTHVSHSTVEKQRRDRINALIDELRDMVPPQSPNSAAQDGLDSKRPKHVVLSDTIQLIRDLQHKARLSESPPIDSSQGTLDLFRKAHSGGSGRGEADGKPVSPPELPLAPEGALPSSGVVVEQGEGCLYVKVNCKDRRGLLSDIITSLKAIPLEITTAAVTTTGNGYVHDVFQVKLDPSSKVSAQDIQCHVHATMYLSEHQLGDKRRRVRG